MQEEKLPRNQDTQRRMRTPRLQHATTEICFSTESNYRYMPNYCQSLDASSCTARSQWKSQPLLLLCAHWHCHDEEKGHGVPSLECWRHGPIFRRKRHPFSSVLCVNSWFLGGGWRLIRKQPNRWLHLGFRIISIDPSFVTCQHFPGQFWTASVELYQHELAPLNPTPSLFVCQRGGDLSCTSFSDTKTIVQYGHGRCRSDAKTFLILSSGNPWFGPNYFFHCLDFVTVTTVAGVPHRWSSSKLHLPLLHSTNHKKTWVLDGAC